MGGLGIPHNPNMGVIIGLVEEHDVCFRSIVHGVIFLNPHRLEGHFSQSNKIAFCPYKG